MFATWPGSSTVDASHASEVKSIYASARCTCTAHGTRLVGTLPPLAPPSVRGERSILCKQVLTEDSTRAHHHHHYHEQRYQVVVDPLGWPE